MSLQGWKLTIVRQSETSNFPHGQHISPRYLSAWASKKKRNQYVSRRVGKPYCLCSFLYFTPFTTVSNMRLKITYKTTSFKALGGRITQTFETQLNCCPKFKHKFDIDKYNFIYKIFMASCRSANRRDWEQKNNDNIC